MAIGKYNSYIGGIDLADQQRLHSNCTIMGLLDVGTASAVVLYNATLVNGNRMNINNFKCWLAMNFAGERISPILVPVMQAVHELQRTNSRPFCNWCSLSNRKKRTKLYL
jgi:hypothetical protein